MKPKKFDCVKMKHDIQRQLLEEMAGLSLEEQRRRTEGQILSDPILGPLWRRLRQRTPEKKSVRKA